MGRQWFALREHALSILPRRESKRAGRLMRMSNALPWLPLFKVSPICAAFLGSPRGNGRASSRCTGGSFAPTSSKARCAACSSTNTSKFKCAQLRPECGDVKIGLLFGPRLNGFLRNPLLTGNALCAGFRIKPTVSFASYRAGSRGNSFSTVEI
jgi:hypothetical protein